jgi:hypothetical protein
MSLISAMIHPKVENDDGFVPVTFMRGARIIRAKLHCRLVSKVGTANIINHVNRFAILETTLVEDEYLEYLTSVSFPSVGRKSMTKQGVPKENPRAWHPDEIDQCTLDSLLNDYVTSSKYSPIDSFVKDSLQKVFRVVMALDCVPPSHSDR